MFDDTCVTSKNNIKCIGKRLDCIDTSDNFICNSLFNSFFDMDFKVQGQVHADLQCKGNISRMLEFRDFITLYNT